MTILPRVLLFPNARLSLTTEQFYIGFSTEMV